MTTALIVGATMELSVFICYWEVERDGGAIILRIKNSSRWSSYFGGFLLVTKFSACQRQNNMTYTRPLTHRSKCNRVRMKVFCDLRNSCTPQPLNVAADAFSISHSSILSSTSSILFIGSERQDEDEKWRKKIKYCRAILKRRSVRSLKFYQMMRQWVFSSLPNERRNKKWNDGGN